ncbi:metallophosphoesterase family protein [Psychrobacillus sp. PGGUH221]|uniref:metallophosphoesterase n=1 Tax=Psychrobacillus sp. PGGUH221 TaxID=3020058 RepID=UPI0035C6CDD8
MTYIIILFIIFSATLMFYMRFLAFQTNVIKHSLQIEEMKDGEQFNIFFISDIHRRQIPEKLIHSLVGEVDIVVIGGDLTEKGVPQERTENNIVDLSKLGPVYYVYGNNDREIGEEHLNSILEKNDVVILNNTSLAIHNNHSVIRLVGINDGFSGRVRIYDAFQEVSENEVVVFVCHAPAFFNNAKKVAKPHLLMAGHLHGGQIRLGPIGIYEKGTFRVKENSAELVSNGFGTTGIHLRLGAKSECHLITLFGKQ